MQGIGRGQDDGFGPHAVQHLRGVGEPGCAAQVECAGVRHRIGYRHQFTGMGRRQDGLDVPLADQAGGTSAGFPTGNAGIEFGNAGRARGPADHAQRIGQAQLGHAQNRRRQVLIAPGRDRLAKPQAEIVASHGQKLNPP